MHKTEIVTLNGREIPVDIGMVDIIVKLNELGVETKGCCIGMIDLYEGVPWIQVGNTKPDNQETQDLIRRTVEIIGNYSKIPILLLDPSVVPMIVGEDNLLKFISYKFMNDVTVKKLKNVIILDV